MSKREITEEPEITVEEVNEETVTEMNEENNRVMELEAKIEEDNRKIKDLEDRFLRIQAETQNYKRRMEEEKDRSVKYANEHLIEELLPVLDNFERAINLDDQNLEDELSKFLQGFKMIYGSFVNVLNDIELKEIEALDKPFDPNYHQAVLTDKDETKEDGIVLEVLQKGYMLKDRVIRASMVKVNNL